MFILQKGSVAKPNLVEPPFTQIHPNGIRGIFRPEEVEEILQLTQKVAA
jgi:type I restriction enzyme R subunit